MFGISVRWLPTILLTAAPLAFMLWALVDAASQPAEAWKRTRHRQWVSVVACLFFMGFYFSGVIVLLPFGAAYYATVRPALMSARRAQREPDASPPPTQH